MATLLIAGTCTIQASQAGSVMYAAASGVLESFNVALASQTISFSSIPSQVINTSVPVVLTASASSGLAVSFTSSTPGVCTVTGAAATLISAGSCTIQANQPGNTAYAPAATAMQTFTVASASQLAGLNFGNVNIGSPSSAMTLTFTISTSFTLGSVSVTTQGATALDFNDARTGSCTVGTTYNVGDSCTVNVTFTPTLAGTRYGATLLADAAGHVIATDYLQGTGIGPQVNFLPSTESTISTSNLNQPKDIAVDSSGNVYIVDTNHNRVLKETLTSGSYVETVLTTSTLNTPSGIAVDGSGNIYIVDTNNQRILKETLSAGGYSESVLPTSTLSNPIAAVVDGSGNIYVADTSNNRVLLETLSSGTYTERVLPTSGLGYPSGVAVDGSGNIYIADTLNNRILKETLSSGGYVESTVSTSTLTTPGAIAVDGNGNIYIVDTGNNRILKETPSGGSYAESTMSTGYLTNPSGIAVDGSGNVFVANTSMNQILKEDFADPPSLSFANTAVGTTSADSPQTVTVENIGNAGLNFPVPTTGNNPTLGANFTLDSSVTSACPLVSAGSATAGILAAGQSCLLPVSFMPSVAGTVSSTLVLTDNTLNAAAPGYATQSVFLSGGTATSTTATGANAARSQSIIPLNIRPQCINTPLITSVSASKWIAGQTYAINIMGTGFASARVYTSNPRFWYCPTLLNVNVDVGTVNVDYQVVNSTLIKATITPAADDPPEPAIITVENFQVFASPINPAVTTSASLPSPTPGSFQAQIQVPLPTDLKMTKALDLGEGDLHVFVAWHSTTGDTDDLTQCIVGETVTYNGPSPYPWPKPFPPLKTANPTENSSRDAAKGTEGSGGDDHWLRPTPNTPPPPFRKPYFANSFDATQKYWYSCKNYQHGKKITLLGPLTITRTVAPNGSGGWKFTVSKTGIDTTATINPLP
jgi:sugar lactone lactonase YvrE